MDTKKYEVLISVAESGNMTETARLLGYSQSRVTQIIADLEEELGTQLLIRGNRGVVLSSAAETIVPYMRYIIKAENLMQLEINKMNGIITGDVRIGSLSSLSYAWLPGIIKSFNSRYPYINIHLVEHETAQLEKLLLTGELDLVLMEKLPGPKSYVFDELLTDPVVAVVSKEHPLASCSSVSLNKLKAYPFVSYSTGSATPLGAGWPELAVNKKTDWDIRFTCKDDYTAMRMVSMNLGVSLSSQLMVENYNIDVVAIPLDKPVIRTLGLAYRSRKNMPPATRALLESIVL
ncbi:MAG: LysR family transcriptional regulator [Clostridiales bacterium]|nr:LysR family transcriptional regulator [Candidatus Crickella merdequi]